MVPEATFTSYYGRPDRQEAGVGGARHRRLPLPGRARRRARRCWRRAPTGRRLPGAAPGRRGCRAGCARRLGVALVHDLGRPDAVPQHAAGVQADVADERRHVDAGRVRAVAGLAAAAESAGGCPGLAAATSGAHCRPGRGRARSRRCSARRSRPTRRCCSPTPPSRRGTTRTASCRSCSSAAPPAAAGGMGLLTAPVTQAGPARRLAVGGAALDLAVTSRPWSPAWVCSAEPMHQGTAGRLLAGRPGAHGGRRAPGARRPAAGADASRRRGAALLAGSACTRFGIFDAGQQSARDPRYTVVPQRERLERRGRGRAGLRRRHPALHPKGVMASPVISATTLSSGSVAEATGSSS